MPASGIITELVLLDGKPSGRIQCEPLLIPSPGQYLLAYGDESDSPLAAPVFSARSFAEGFLAAPPMPTSWTVGAHLNLRGPLGKGFLLPKDARRVALIAFDECPSRLTALLDGAVNQEAAITLVCGTPPDDLPLQVEVQPLNVLADVCQWADWIAMDVARDALPGLWKIIRKCNPLITRNGAQILIRTPMPCGALAECSVCAIEGQRGRLLACKDGPVFDLKDLWQE
ncbi:MAG TPA: hypothetical protein VLX61_12680 [Anaerolineales bacterium]|nr:hypothetical protein [Anaerolineales bacterium]